MDIGVLAQGGQGQERITVATVTVIIMFITSKLI